MDEARFTIVSRRRNVEGQWLNLETGWFNLVVDFPSQISGTCSAVAINDTVQYRYMLEFGKRKIKLPFHRLCIQYVLDFGDHKYGYENATKFHRFRCCCFLHSTSHYLPLIPGGGGLIDSQDYCAGGNRGEGLWSADAFDIHNNRLSRFPVIDAYMQRGTQTQKVIINAILYELERGGPVYSDFWIYPRYAEKFDPIRHDLGQPHGASRPPVNDEERKIIFAHSIMIIGSGFHHTSRMKDSRLYFVYRSYGRTYGDGGLMRIWADDVNCVWVPFIPANIISHYEYNGGPGGRSGDSGSGSGSGSGDSLYGGQGGGGTFNVGQSSRQAFGGHSRTLVGRSSPQDSDHIQLKVRTGDIVANEDILGFAKLFNDELTLEDNIRPRLVNMCKYMGIQSYGTDSYLRFMLRQRLQRIKIDDKMIQSEGGVEALSEEELREDCRERGMLGFLSAEEMRQQLRDWLDLSLNHSVPSSLLILSRAFTMSGKLKPDDVVSLPDEVVETVSVTSEDSVSERRRKSELLETQEELIKGEEKELEEQAKMKEAAIKLTRKVDVALKEMTIPTASYREAQEQARAIAQQDKQEHLRKLSEALAVLASASPVSREREEFLRKLVNKEEIELYHTMVNKEDTEGEKEAMKSYRAAREESDKNSEKAVDDGVSSALIDMVDAMLHNLEKEIDDVDAKIGDFWCVRDKDYDGKFTPDEVAAAAMYLKDTLRSKEGVQELINNLFKDKEGKILVGDSSVKSDDSREESHPPKCSGRVDEICNFTIIPI